METKFKTLVIGLFAVSAVFTSCQKDMLYSENTQYASILDVSPDGISTVNNENMQSAFKETSGLTVGELNLLLIMKEEEKLAGDLYGALFQIWGSNLFYRISLAENNHLNAIIRLLQYYGSADTLAGTSGVFANAGMQNLYDSLLSAGTASVQEAYKAGALVEEMDIKDLREAVKSITNTNMIMVFENLERGSRNHLRAFSRQLASLDLEYIPRYLTPSEYDQIINSATEKGNQYRMKANTGKGNGNCNTGTGPCL